MPRLLSVGRLALARVLPWLRRSRLDIDKWPAEGEPNSGAFTYAGTPICPFGVREPRLACLRCFVSPVRRLSLALSRSPFSDSLLSASLRPFFFSPALSHLITERTEPEPRARFPSVPTARELAATVRPPCRRSTVAPSSELACSPRKPPCRCTQECDFRGRELRPISSSSSAAFAIVDSVAHRRSPHK